MKKNYIHQYPCAVARLFGLASAGREVGIHFVEPMHIAIVPSRTATIRTSKGGLVTLARALGDLDFTPIRKDHEVIRTTVRSL